MVPEGGGVQGQVSGEDQDGQGHGGGDLGELEALTGPADDEPAPPGRQQGNHVQPPEAQEGIERRAQQQEGQREADVVVAVDQVDVGGSNG